MDNTLSDFAQGRLNGLLNSVQWWLLTIVVPAIFSWLSPKLFVGRFSLRTRLTVGAILIGLFATLGSHYLNITPWVAVLVTIANIVLTQTVLDKLSAVGIMNAFPKTSSGISAENSLDRVKKSVDFLGIGAKKLTDNTEKFEAMLKRCKNANGAVRFLLSDPENSALEEIASHNERDKSIYKLRVKEGIKEVFHQAQRVGVRFEVRLYNLDQKFPLPPFRLMFVDSAFCLFSYVKWNNKEGLDNPQLVLRDGSRGNRHSLYSAFHDYYESIWEKAKPLNQTEIDQL